MAATKTFNQMIADLADKVPAHDKVDVLQFGILINRGAHKAAHRMLAKLDSLPRDLIMMELEAFGFDHTLKSICKTNGWVWTRG